MYTHTQNYAGPGGPGTTPDLIMREQPFWCTGTAGNTDSKPSITGFGLAQFTPPSTAARSIVTYRVVWNATVSACTCTLHVFVWLVDLLHYLKHKYKHTHTHTQKSLEWWVPNGGWHFSFAYSNTPVTAFEASTPEQMLGPSSIRSTFVFGLTVETSPEFLDPVTIPRE